jgi:hypothetical protein
MNKSRWLNLSAWLIIGVGFLLSFGMWAQNMNADTFILMFTIMIFLALIAGGILTNTQDWWEK